MARSDREEPKLSQIRSLLQRIDDMFIDGSSAAARARPHLPPQANGAHRPRFVEPPRPEPMEILNTAFPDKQVTHTTGFRAELARSVEATQCWIYRAPKGFERSRIIAGATVEVSDGRRIVCCSVVEAPWRMNASAYETMTIPFLPLTEAAFRATVLDLEGHRESPPGFAEKLAIWKDDRNGLAAFTVPFDGFLDSIIELQKAWKRAAARASDPATARMLAKMREMLNSGLITERHPFPKNKKEFEAVLTRIRNLEPGDVESKLIVAGFQPHPSADQKRCLECTYYLPHCSACDLPEIGLPVEPYWSCRLWAI